MYTPLRIEEIKQELGRRRLVALGLAVLSAPLAIALIGVRHSQEAQFLGYDMKTFKIAGVIVLAIIAFAFQRLWRCPGCNARLHELRPEECPECDVKFRTAPTP